MSRNVIVVFCGAGLACGPGDCPKGSERWADGLCHLLEDDVEQVVVEDSAVPADTAPPDDTSAPDTGEPGCDALPDGIARGLPVVRETSIETDVFMEYLDVALLGDGRALLGANNGWSVVDVASMAFTHVESVGHQSVWRVAADPASGLAYFGTQINHVAVVDITSDPPTTGRRIEPWSGWHADLSAEGGRLLVAALDDGAWLIEGATQETLGRIPSHATAVQLDGDRAWVAGTESVGLWDLSDTRSPTLLAEAPLPVPAIDAAGNGERVVLALGAEGVVGVTFDGTGLTVHPSFDTDGAAYGVAADGEQVWAASWRAVSLGRWTDAGPEWLGEAASPMFAMGVDARDGTAVAADWQLVSRYTGDASLGGPELRMVDRIDVSGEGPHTLSVRVENAGVGELSLAWSGDGAPDDLSLCPGESRSLSVEVSAVPLALPYETNDLDESSGLLSIQQASGQLGAVHTDFTLEAIQAGSTTSSPWSLSEHAGELVYIAWFAPT